MAIEIEVMDKRETRERLQSEHPIGLDIMIEGDIITRHVVFEMNTEAATLLRDKLTEALRRNEESEYQGVIEKSSAEEGVNQESV